MGYLDSVGQYRQTRESRRLWQQAYRSAIIGAVGVILVLSTIGAVITDLINPANASFTFLESLGILVVALIIALMGLGGMANYSHRIPKPRRVTWIFAGVLIVWGGLALIVNLWYLISQSDAAFIAMTPWVLPVAALVLAIGIAALSLGKITRN